MKALSVWQPWALMLVTGFKKIETRPWPLPSCLIGEEIAIGACKSLKREQRDAYNAESFQMHYSDAGLPPLTELPRGVIVGKVRFVACRMMDEALFTELSDRELSLGIYDIGRYAWFAETPVRFDTPIPASGRLGLWDWDDEQVGTA